MSDDPPCVASEEGDEVELPGGEVDGAAVDGHRPAGEVDAKRSDDDHRVVGGRVEPVAMAEGHPESGFQLGHAERLGDEVVGAFVERLDLACLGAVRREHHDGHLTPLAEAPAHLDPVDVGQPEVEHDHVGLLQRGLGQALLARLRGEDVVPRRRRPGSSARSRLGRGRGLG